MHAFGELPDGAGASSAGRGQDGSSASHRFTHTELSVDRTTPTAECPQSNGSARDTAATRGGREHFSSYPGKHFTRFYTTPLYSY